MNHFKENIILSAAVSFMLCIFAPLETYLTNIGEFWYGIGDMLPVILVTFAVAGLAVYIMLWLFGKTPLHTYIYTIGFFLYLELYIQGNYIPRNYGVLDGRPIKWELYKSYGMASIVLLSIIFLLIILSSIFLKKKIISIGNVVCILLILVQISTIGTLAIQNANPSDNNDSNKIVTSASMLELTDNRNVVVILLDSFGSDVFMEMMQEDRATIDTALQDFTYYPDTVGAYPTTVGGMSYILTGSWYKNEEVLSDHIQSAYEDNAMYDALEAQDYSIGVYTDGLYMSNDVDMYVNAENGNYKISDYRKFWGYIYRMVAFNYVPHQFKSGFMVYSPEAEKMRTADTNTPLYSEDTVEFYNNLTRDGITTIPEGNAFRFYHLDGVHREYTFDSNLETGTQDYYTVYDEGWGCMKLIEEYKQQLKDAGVYDNTTIIIMADHSIDRGITRGRNPIFMIKNFDEHHDFEVSDAALSYEDFQPTITEIVTGEDVPGSIWSNEVAEREVRKFYIYSNDVSYYYYLPDLIEYDVTGPAYEVDSMKATGNIYKDTGKVYDEHMHSYNLGEMINFTSSNDPVRKYVEYGSSGLDGEGIWTIGNEFMMSLEIDEPHGDLSLEMDYEDYYCSQTVEVYVNDTYLGTMPESHKITIPADCVPDGIINIKLELPDAVVPISIGDGNEEWARALYIKSVKVDK